MNIDKAINQHAVRTTGKPMLSEHWELFKACAVKAKPKAKKRGKQKQYSFLVIDDELPTQTDLDYLAGKF